MNRKIKKTLKIISDVLIIIVVLLAFLLHGLQFFGLTPYSVLSGSMESVYPTGSLIYVKKTEPEKLEVNDIITFKLPSGAVATHRIIELVADEKDESIVRFRTKGDENDVADGSLVDFDRVIGTPVFCIPSLGVFASYISVPPGRYIAISTAIALILAEIMIGFIVDDKKENNQDGQDDNEEKNTEQTQI